MITHKIMKFYTGYVLSFTILSIATENDFSIQHLKGHGIEFVEFCFTDPFGNFKSITYPINMVRDDKFNIFIDGSSIKGCTRIAESDLQLIPDWQTVRVKPTVPSARTTTALVVCDLAVDNHMPYEHDPRTILKKVIQECTELGYRLVIGTELEFFIVQKDENELVAVDQGKYFDGADHPQAEIALRSLLKSLAQMEIHPEKLHHEVAPGQYEISLRHDNALTIADNIVLAKQVISQFMRQFGLHATFMPKPFNAHNGSGMHIHFSLFDQENNNLFYNSKQPGHLSPLGMAFIAGILDHANEFTLLFNPLINSYKRLVPGFEAPIYICCGTKNRSALIRIPLFDHVQSGAARAELRSPDPGCNPYLAFAALCKAGLDGIKHSRAISIFEKNLYQATQQELTDAHITTIPGSIDQSIEAFKHSNMAKELLGLSLHETIVQAKQQEIAAYQRTVTNWEINAYA